MLKLDISFTKGFVTKNDIEAITPEVIEAAEILTEKKGKGCEFTGWVDLPSSYDRDEFARIKKAAEKIRKDSEVLVVIGIGGSYLGAKAAIEFLSGAFGRKQGGRVLFAGNSLSADSLCDLIDEIRGKDFSINIISKSGTTTEPAIAFRILKGILEERYGKEEAASRIYATTDKQKGTLKELADLEGYEEFVVPDDVGGRYSVLTAVGLLPIAAAGIDIDALMAGAEAAEKRAMSAPLSDNPALLYAAVRNILYRKGKEIEILANYEPQLHYLGEWWKQLYGESEGKDGKGLFPAAVDLTTDLHSMGQYVQDGKRVLLETVLDVEAPLRDITVPFAEGNADGLQYLNGRKLSEINREAMNGAVFAHAEGGVPVMRVSIPGRDEKSLGELFYFFEYACGVSGYLGKVNPFDQPGVENYKKNMFALLGKPGYEELQKQLKER